MVRVLNTLVLMLVAVLSLSSCSKEEDYGSNYEKVDKEGLYECVTPSGPMRVDVFGNGLTILSHLDENGNVKDWTFGTYTRLADYYVTLQIDKNRKCESLLLKDIDGDEYILNRKQSISESWKSNAYANVWGIKAWMSYRKSSFTDDFEWNAGASKDEAVYEWMDMSIAPRYRNVNDADIPIVAQLELTPWGTAYLFFAGTEVGYAKWEEEEGAIHLYEFPHDSSLKTSETPKHDITLGRDGDYLTIESYYTVSKEPMQKVLVYCEKVH